MRRQAQALSRHLPLKKRTVSHQPLTQQDGEPACCICVLKMQSQGGARAVLPVAGLQRRWLVLTQLLACQHPARAKSPFSPLQE